MSNILAAIFSLSGLQLNDAERDLFKAANPLGFILFARNCETPEQMRALSDDLKDTLGRDCPIMIDQEGGRVQRLSPPVWRGYPPAASFGARMEANENKALDDLRFCTLQLGEELTQAGINVNCAPVLDVAGPDTHDAIGDRAFSDKPEVVGRLGLSVCRHLLSLGIRPVIKHMPGQGRADLDSHKDLPRISASLADLQTDFKPFEMIAAADEAPAIWGMLAHVIYEALDPDHPASVSPKIITDIIRKQMGFDGFLVSDDLDMDALDGYGDIPARALATLDAGCDAALYCAGKHEIMEKIAESVPNLSEKALQRLQNAAEFRKVAA